MLHARADYQNRIVDAADKNPELLVNGASPIPAGEPVFLLRAQDSTAAATVRFWIRENRKQLKTVKDEATRAGIKKALALAEAHAYRMDDWPTKKPADVK